MSELNLNALSPGALMAQFVLAKRGSGLSLSPADFAQLGKWLNECQDPDQLLSVLDDIIPEANPARRPVPLKYFDARVRKRLVRRCDITTRF